MKLPYVTSTINNGAANITFFHPQSNSLPSMLLKELVIKIEAASNNPEAKVIVLQSEGDNTFCAGGSFDEMVKLEDAEISKTFFMGFASVINAIRKSPKFVIARVQGKVVGGGVGIVSAADYALAIDTAPIKLSELAIGIGPFVIGPAVHRKIGVAAFSALTINATEFKTAEWAHDKGLYADIYPSIAELDAALLKLTDQLVKSNPEAMRLLKQKFWAGTEHWDTLLAEQAEIVGKLVLSDFTKNAINKFKKNT
jgi:methylglutaconyl-CoA hydratase